jgi:uncharacterized protein with HEPN domain
MPRDLSWLQDIITAGERVARFIQDLDLPAFLADEEKQSAVFGQIVIVGEAANRVSQEFRDAHPDIPWRKVIGMRHRIVHGYDEIDWEIVWHAAARDIPKLLADIRPLLAEDAR